jgi:hypothetical protein
MMGTRALAASISERARKVKGSVTFWAGSMMSQGRNYMQEQADAATKTVDRELVLHYIDKLYTIYGEMGREYNRIFFLLILASFIVFGLSLGIVSVDRSFAFGGLTVGVNSGLLLIGGSTLIGVLLIYMLSLNDSGQVPNFL